MGANVAEFTDTNFDSEVLQSDKPVLVDFWATWCGPCRQIAPMIDEIATDNSDAVKVGKVNIDEHPRSAQKYGVTSIPTLIIFKNGEVVQKFVGIQPKARLQEALDSAAGA
jgi:thioredoxin 1